MNSFYVYAYFEPGSRLPFYIGKGKGLRKLDHLQPHMLRRQTAMACKLRNLLSNGIKPSVIVLKDNLSEDTSHELERAIISRLGRRDRGTGCLMNHTDGGEGSSGIIVSAESRQKMSRSHKGHIKSVATRKRLSASLSGRSITWGDKISLARKTSPVAQRKIYEAACRRQKPIVAIDAESGEWQVFDGRNVAATFGFNSGGIHTAMRKHRPHKGYFWAYLSEKCLQPS